jgi:hypothetical protein
MTVKSKPKEKERKMLPANQNINYDMYGLGISVYQYPLSMLLLSFGDFVVSPLIVSISYMQFRVASSTIWHWLVIP